MGSAITREWFGTITPSYTPTLKNADIFKHTFLSVGV
jgi:hypothetical protein